MTSTASKILLSALGLGLAGDGLLRGGTWRLGFATWIVALIATAVMLGARRTREHLFLLTGLALAAFGLVWRDAPMLFSIDFASVLCAGALLLWYGTDGDMQRLTIVETVRAGVLAVINSVAGAAAVLVEVSELRDGQREARTSARALLIGTVLALPPLLLVASLLASSDVVFDSVLQRALHALTSDGLTHVIIVALLTWITTGWLRASLGEGIGTWVPHVRAPGLQFTSVAVGLYALILLLACFLVTQARVVFGGAAFLRETAGLTVATYARDGFFQLIAAAAIVLVTLTMAEWLMDDEDDAGHLHFSIAGSVLLILVVTLLVSAAVRIWLYVAQFGLSVDRAFASAGIVWVSGLLIAFALTTLRRRATQFMPVSIAVTVAWVMMVNLANPEALVVRVNLARASRGEAFDAAYHAKLSADALPAIVAAAPRLEMGDCLRLEAALQQVWRDRRETAAAGRADWRSMDLPLVRAATWANARQPLCVSTAR